MIIKIHLTHPWLITVDAPDHVSVWNWEYRQVTYELKASGVDERHLVRAKLEKLAKGKSEIPKVLRLRAFRPSNGKIVKIEIHPTHPWLVMADASDHVSIWNWKHRQVIYELKVGDVDERRLGGAKLEKLAKGESGISFLSG